MKSEPVSRLISDSVGTSAGMSDKFLSEKHREKKYVEIYSMG